MAERAEQWPPRDRGFVRVLRLVSDGLWHIARVIEEASSALVGWSNRLVEKERRAGCLHLTVVSAPLSWDAPHPTKFCQDCGEVVIFGGSDA